MFTVSLTSLNKALSSLEQGYNPNANDLERDGIILRFKCTLELCWKTSKNILLENGIETDTPKNVIRELGQIGWINDPSVWLDYIDKRNMTSHMYNEEVAQQIFEVIDKFIIDVHSLIKVLESKNS